MRSRMERYQEEQRRKREEPIRRSEKNQELYDTLYTNTKYTEFTDVASHNAVELTALEKNYKTREGYHQLKEYENVLVPPKVKRELEDFEALYKEEENKIYDINSVLTEAKKNRSEIDDLERKRKLRSTQYNILSNLNLEELEKFREEKRRRTTPDTEERQIQELIDTITSKTLGSEVNTAIGADLMSDLLPSTQEETLITASIKTEENSQEMTESPKKESLDQSFYTKSMDLSEEDLEMDSEFEEEEKSPKWHTILKVFLFLFLFGIVTTIIYFVLQQL